MYEYAFLYQSIRGFQLTCRARLVKKGTTILKQKIENNTVKPSRTDTLSRLTLYSLQREHYVVVLATHERCIRYRPKGEFFV